MVPKWALWWAACRRRTQARGLLFVKGSRLPHGPWRDTCCPIKAFGRMLDATEEKSHDSLRDTAWRERSQSVTAAGAAPWPHTFPKKNQDQAGAWPRPPHAPPVSVPSFLTHPHTLSHSLLYRSSLRFQLVSDSSRHCWVPVGLLGPGELLLLIFHQLFNLGKFLKC